MSENLTSAFVSTSGLCEDDACATPTAGTGSVEDAGYEGDGRPFAQTEEIEWLLWFLDIFIVSTYTPLIAFGLTGNSLSFYLIWGKAKSSSTYNYLCSLCVVDNLFLTVSILGWLIGFGTGVDWRGVIDCNVIMGLVRIPKLSSAWLLVAVSTERTLVVFLPTRSKRICDVRIARAVIGCIIAGICVLQWPVFGAYETLRDVKETDYGQDVCRPRTDGLKWYMDAINSWIRTSVYSYIPSVLLLSLNTAMAARFARAARDNRVGVHKAGNHANQGNNGAGHHGSQRNNAAGNHGNQGNNAAGNHGNQGNNAAGNHGNNVEQTGRGKKVLEVSARGRTMAKNSRRMTIMALTLSVTFLALTLPGTLFYVWFSARRDDLIRDMTAFYRAWVVRNALGVLEHANHAINFALYCLTSASFRRDMRELVTCRKVRARVADWTHAHSTATGTTERSKVT